MKTLKLNCKKLTQLMMIVGVTSATLYSCKCEKGTKTDGDKAAVAATDSADADGAAALGAMDGDNFVYNTGDTIDVNLPDGSVLRVGDKSTEAKLFNRLNGDYAVSDSVKSDDWMVMDRVYFAVGKDELTPESKMQIENVSKIMKNFPNATLKLGGYTDNTGSEQTNVTVSTQRANSVMNDLVAEGIDASRLKAEGFGPQYPVCPANDTPECQAQNRRVDIRISAK